jgi:CRP/FNR family cyclic AMP-dependent transcriptional regulator
MPEQIADLVAHHPLLAGLPGDAVPLVAGCAQNVAVNPGRLLLAEGEPANSLYLLRRGRVTIEVHAPGREPMVIETLGPGDLVGWSSLFPPYLWHFDVRATSPVGAISVDAVCLRSKAEAEPDFGYALMKRLAAIMLDRLQATRMRLLDLYGEGPGGPTEADPGPPGHRNADVTASAR